jgi:undecaprenyl diphosphate synthase
LAGGLKPDFPVPEHVAVIMDGNGRWAQRASLERVLGHEAGIASTRDVTEASAEWGIRHLTLYAFSSENWERPKAERDALMELLARQLVAERPTLLDNDVQLRGIGRLDELPASVRASLQQVEADTAHCSTMIMRLALSYGGRQEIVDAVRKLAVEVAAGRMRPEDIDPEAISGRLYDPEMPDPDLIIRTGGDERISNFLLWESSYAELYFTRVLWPDFRREHLLEALRDFHGRVRRFGRVLEADPSVPPAR